MFYWSTGILNKITSSPFFFLLGLQLDFNRLHNVSLLFCLFWHDFSRYSQYLVSFDSVLVKVMTPQ